MFNWETWHSTCTFLSYIGSSKGITELQGGYYLIQVVKGGPGLAFIIYPEVVTMMEISHVWAVLFFAMLISLALGSIFGAFETVISALSDQFAWARENRSR